MEEAPAKLQIPIISTINSKIIALLANRTSDRSKIEVEARIGFFNERKGFVNNIRFPRWQMISDSLDLLVGKGAVSVENLNIVSEVYPNTHYRRRTINGEVSIETKHSFRHCDDDYNNWARYSFSLETPESSLPDTIEEPIIRNIERKRYHFKKLFSFVDLSRVEMKGKIQYELEVELDYNPKVSDILKRFLLCVRKITSLMNGTRIYYTINELKAFNMFVNVNLPVKSDTNSFSRDIMSDMDVVKRQILPEPRSLIISDLRKGKLYGSNIVYDVGYKKDGIHYLLVITHNGVFITSPPYHTSLISNDIYEVVTPNEFCIFETEIIDPFAQKLDIFIIDCLVVNGLNIRSTRSRATRLREGKRFITDLYQRRAIKINTDIILDDTRTMDEENVKVFPFQLFNLHWDSVHSFSTYEDMKRIVTFLIENRPSYPPTDGLIFTPTNTPYDFAVHFGKGKTEDKPAILKWKPPNQVTIDFRIKKEEDGIQFYVDNRDKSTTLKEIPFKGTRNRPFDNKKMIDIASIPESAYGEIAEFEWKPDPVNKFSFIRIRSLKASPNREAVAIDNWKLVLNPVDIDTLSGKGMGLLRFYHNRIKEELLNDARDIHLDIGSGNGGDIGKWKNCRLVFVVEPVEEHIETLRERIKTSDFIEIKPGDPININSRMICITKGYGQDTELITNTIRYVLNPNNDPNIISGVDSISMMDVGTFFWENVDILTRVAETIKRNLNPGGNILWKMMDGDSVRYQVGIEKGLSKLESFYYQLKEGDGLNIEGFKIIATGVRNQIRFQFQGGIAGDQIEYLTRITDLYRILGPEFEVERQERADNPKSELVTGDSFMASKLYLFGKIVRRKGKQSTNKLLSPLITEFIPLEEVTPITQLLELRPKPVEKKMVALSEKNIRTAQASIKPPRGGKVTSTSVPIALSVNRPSGNRFGLGRK